MISFAYHFSHLNLPLTIRTGGAPSPATEHEYAYDPIGNRTSSSDLGTTRAYTANSLNQYTGISDGVDTFNLVGK